MKYQMSQHLLSFGDDFTIKNDAGNVAFKVDGKVLSFGDSLDLLTADGRKLLDIDQKMLSLGATYDIKSAAGEHLATVKKSFFTLVGSKFKIEREAAGDLEARGDFLDREYEITRDGRTAARVSKAFFSLRDC